MATRKRLSVDDYVAGFRAGDRAVLARAITLVESDAPRHVALAQEVLTALLPQTGGARRVGISGVPGVGKSTFIDAFGTLLTQQGLSVAVLAIDPSSSVTGGSILGDKTRMAKLSRDDKAFIRPSPTSGTLGGVHRKTRETMLLCEAFGFDVVLIETVGVGQSETVVADMVDFYLVLMLAGAGDELQGIKRGILEVADMLAINKADGENEIYAKRARVEYETALHLMRGHGGSWHPPVLTCSALLGVGLAELWAKVEEHHKKLSATGELEARRQKQLVRWMWNMIEERLMSELHAAPAVRALLPTLEQQLRGGQVTATTAATAVLDAFEHHKTHA
ncbi:MAG: methylmalonyl Co-A mutase-associated GTPase MeaB [Polyangiales bacterium]|nr:methylmalonyl Co-A mutase-associated GTPase MeaB [Myxococcales bacterium]MCB9661280.1 methylmalonyl Co-A mutase-associated GTPase MeaB [Sandaracinaceae bacterium]